MKEALYYIEKEKGKVQCLLCPHNCILPPGKTGSCRVRKNVDGKLIAENYGLVAAKNLDPIEKKPLYHFFPGSVIFSIGTTGCNLHCSFCQNSQISQNGTEAGFLRQLSPAEAVEEAKSLDANIGIAYTYNEPVIWYEHVIETAGLARKKGLKNVMISNGYINREPAVKLIELMDAFNIDIKAFSTDFYYKLTKSTLPPVLDTIKQISRSGKHLELTCLVIPGKNDDPGVFLKMLEWIKNETGEDTVLHISRYFPHHRESLPPTPLETMDSLYQLASEQLRYVYTGNLHNTSFGTNTFCKNCHSELIKRDGYRIEISGLAKTGCCSKCGTQILKNVKLG